MTTPTPEPSDPAGSGATVPEVDGTGGTDQLLDGGATGDTGDVKEAMGRAAERGDADLHQGGDDKTIDNQAVETGGRDDLPQAGSASRGGGAAPQVIQEGAGPTPSR